MKPSTRTKIAALGTACLIATAIAFFWWVDQTRPEVHLAPPPTNIEPQYAGNAVLRRYQASEAGPTPPRFVVRVPIKDYRNLVRHIENTAARRHWVPTKTEYSNAMGFVMPDRKSVV